MFHVHHAAAPAPSTTKQVVYHGSSDFNWFSILRFGMRSMSSTVHMSTGAIHGPGIYVASDINTARQYATRGLVAECELGASRVPGNVVDKKVCLVVSDASLLRVVRLHVVKA